MKFGLFSRKRNKRLGHTLPEDKGYEPDQKAQLTGEGCPDEVASSADVSAPNEACGSANCTGESREKRVAELRHQVGSGTYEIPFASLVRILAARLFRGH